MRKTDDQFRQLMDAERELEAETARWIMRDRGCTWGQALQILKDGETADRATD